MIDFTKYSIKEVLNRELHEYFSSRKEYLLRLFMRAEKAMIYKFQRYLRLSEYARFKKRKIQYAYYLRKKNLWGSKLGFSIHCGTFDIGLRIAHFGQIVVNGKAKIGKNCHLLGRNCIGNKNDNDELIPEIGDGFSLGYGSVVYGDITICDNVIVGANSTINKSISIPGIYVGLNKRVAE